MVLVNVGVFGWVVGWLVGWCTIIELKTMMEFQFVFVGLVVTDGGDGDGGASFFNHRRLYI